MTLLLPRLNRRQFLRLAAAASAASVVPIRRARAAVEFDDGNRHVPGGVQGDVERVIVIGAGFAGLSAANALRNAGVEVVVVEGRDRIGGRTWTLDLDGVPVDMGGSWIHGPIGNPMTDLAEHFGVARIPFDPLADISELSGFDANDDFRTGQPAGWLSVGELGLAFLFADQFGAALPGLRAQLGPAATVDDAITPYLDLKGVINPPTRLRSDFGIRLIVEQTSSGPADDLSLLWWAAEGNGNGYSGSDVFPEGGYMRILNGLAAGLDVRTGQTVSQVDYGPGGVVVTTDQEIHAGSHAVMTVPLGVLKAGSIQFSPALPASKLDAIDALGFGYFEKVALRFDEAFWLDESRLNFLYLSATTPMEFPLFLDLTRVVGEPTLVVLCSAAFAQSTGAMSEQVMVDRVLAILREMFGAIPAPTHSAVTRWGSEPFTLGAYSCLSVDSHPDDFGALAEPVAGRLLFAGEATTVERFATADGAMQTGIREAKRLLGAPVVCLPEPGSAWLRGGALAALGALAWWQARGEGLRVDAHR